MTKETEKLLIDCANFIQPYDDGGNEAERLMIRLNEALKQGQTLPIHDISKSYYYTFIYKDEKGELGYTTRKVNKQDNELAIASFEKAFPDLVWREFQEVQP